MAQRFATPVLPDTSRSEQARELSKQRVAVRVRDLAVNGVGHREVECLPLWSRASCPWWERPDIYWNNRVFSAQRGWVSGRDVGSSDANSPKAIGKLILQGQPEDVYHRRYTPDREALLKAAEALCTEPYLSIVSLLRGTGRALGGQLAALAGVESRKDEAGFLKVAAPLQHAEVVESAWHHAPGIAHPRVKAWQIKVGQSYAAWARRVLDMGQGPQVYGCMRASLSARSDMHRVRATRHQALSVEMILRALEASDIWAGWMPETACRPEWFLPPDHPLKHKGLKTIADGCLIRYDGARIFVEVEASGATDDRLREKITSWSALFEEGSFGGAVLFVIATQPSQMGQAARNLRKAISECATAKARPYLLLGSWHDYSPDYGLMTHEAASLRAGRTSYRKWEECHAATIEVAGAERGIAQRVQDMAFTPEWASKPMRQVAA